MNAPAYDLIGDLHGQYEKLEEMLSLLGYRKHLDSFRHPAGRRVVFLGDYIDRGPRIREVLHTVRGMVEAGDALAIMGNHEYNAVCYHTPDGAGDFLRKHREQNVKQHQATVRQFEGRDAEWREWLAWMKTLPFALDLGGLRAVHACWDAEALEFLKGKSLVDPVFLRASAQKGTREFHTVETVLKGPELHLPNGTTYRDKENVSRKTVRVRWWDLPDKAALGDIVMPEPVEIPDDVPAEDLRQVPRYPTGAPPVFFGHYWLPADAPKRSLAENVICLDFSAGLGGPLVSYRWDGERGASEEKFVAGSHQPAAREIALDQFGGVI